MKAKKRIVSFLLAVLMMTSVLPFSVFAEEPPKASGAMTEMGEPESGSEVLAPSSSLELENGTTVPVETEAPVPASSPEVPEETQEPSATVPEETPSTVPTEIPAATSMPTPSAEPTAEPTPTPVATVLPTEVPAPRPVSTAMPEAKPVVPFEPGFTVLESEAGGQYAFPCPGAFVVTQGYGQNHQALDIGADYGSAVVASESGIVTTVQGWDGSTTTGMQSYGNMVMVTHTDGNTTLYAHMSKINVQQGDKVLRGQKLGEVGTSGNVTGAHLHFELITPEGKTDPTPYITGGDVGENCYLYSGKAARTAGLQGTLFVRFNSMNGITGVPLVAENSGTPAKEMKMSDGSFVPTYCLNQAKDAPDGLPYTSIDEIPSQTMTTIKYIVSNGFHLGGNSLNSGRDHWTTARWLVTQALVWGAEMNLIVRNSDGTWLWPDTIDGYMEQIAQAAYNPEEVRAFYPKVKEACLKGYTQPSFAASTAEAAPVITLDYNADNGRYEKTITDSNGVIKNYNYSFTNSNISVTKNGNDITIVSTESLPETGSEAATHQTGGGGETQVWRSASTVYQDLMTGGNTVSVQSYLKIKADPVLYDITLTKTSADVKITNSNSNYSLAGAVYNVYSGSTATGTPVSKFTTDANGHATLTPKLPNGDYTVKEVTAPKGYLLDESEHRLSIKGKSGDLDVVDDPAKVRLKLVKRDKATGNPIPQGNASLAGAVYEVTFQENGVPKAVRGSTNNVGEIVFENIPLGKITVQEITPPVGYKLDLTLHEYDVPSAGIAAIYDLEPDDFTEQVFLGNIALQKNYETLAGTSPEQGAEFQVYLKSAGSYAAAPAEAKDLITTGADGKAATKNLPYGVYTVHQSGGGAGRKFVADFDVNISEDGKTYTYNLTNPQKTGTFKVVKTSESGTVAGLKFKVTRLADNAFDTYITGADGTFTTTGLPVFSTLDGSGKYQYRIEEIETPGQYVQPASQTVTLKPDETTTVNFENRNKKFVLNLTKKDAETGAAQGNGSLDGAQYGLYENGTLRETLTIANGKAASGEYTVTASNLNSVWTVKEIKAPVGYLLDNKVYTLPTVWGSITVERTTFTADSAEQAMKGKFTLHKVTDIDGDKKYEVPEVGAEFTYWLKSAGSYDVAKEAERGVLIIGQDGHAASKNLPYGIYQVRQTKASEGKDMVADFEVNIDSNGVNKVIYKTNKTLEQPVKVLKKDKTTGKVIPLAGFTFKIKDLKKGTYVSQHVNYPTEMDISEFQTDSTGTFKLPYPLYYGKFQLEEIKAVEPYVLDTTPIPFEVTGEGEDIVVVVEKENVPQMGNILITKRGEGFSTVTEKDSVYTPVYGERSWPDAVFEVYANEDITTPEGTVRYGKDELVETVTTGSDGTVRTKNLYLGTYRIVEVQAPDGFVLNTEPILVTLLYAGETVEVTGAEAEQYNARQKVEISLVKEMEQDELFQIGEKEEILNVKFALRAAEELTAEDGSVIPVDGIVEIASCGLDGKLTFTVDLPCGYSYYVQEYATDESYVLSGEKYPVEFAYAGQEIALVQIAVNEGTPIENSLIRGAVKLIKADSGNGERLSGMQGMVYRDINGDGKYDPETDYEIGPVEEGKAGLYTKFGLAYGKYLFHETKAPEGYAVDAGYYPFSIQRDNDMAEVKTSDRGFENKPLQTEISKTDITTGKPVAGATLRILDSKGAIVEQWITGKRPHSIRCLPAGEYVLREELAPTQNGYVRVQEVPFTVRETGEIQKVEMRDDYTKVQIDKTDVSTGEPVNGALLRLLDAKGNTVDEWISGIEPHYMEYLPVGNYTLTEIAAPTHLGYIRVPDIRFYVRETGEIQKVNMKDSFTVVELSKTDITTGEPVIGATLQIKNAGGQVVEQWVTGSEPHTTQYLPVGEYTLVEYLAPTEQGYVRAQEIPFTVLETGKIQKVEMKDDYTKLQVEKTDAETGKPVVGARLRLLDAAGNTVDEWVSDGKPYAFEYLPVGDYTLTEINAPIEQGYVKAVDVKFRVEETGDIQVVEMKDDHTKAVFSKTHDLEKGELPGAHMKLEGLDSEFTEEWISGDKPHEISYLPVGKYILSETKAPEGYTLAEPVTIEVKEIGEIQTFTLQNKAIRGIVQVVKLDRENPSKRLSGAVFEVLQETKEGKVSLGQLTEVEPGVYEMDNLLYGGYTLRESKAPDGYMPDSTERPFRITEDGKTVEVKTGPQDAGFLNTAIKREIVKTGDGRLNPGLVAGTLFVLLSTAAAVALFWYRKRRKGKGGE